MARNSYSDQIKTEALTLLLNGNAASYVSKKLDIPYGTIKSWKAEMSGSRSPEVATQKSLYLGELIAGLLEQQLITLRAIARAAQDEDWIKGQKADDLAIFYGVMTDKSQRLIEAMTGANKDTGDN